ncbi:MAG TPA: GNAT family N-acetyltransferase [Gaiellaceae bacterium]|nr:GNAT family N-acetyltransferase [Gaiellaceae bacterium]
MITARRLGPGDEPIIAALAQEEQAFDVEGRGHPREPIVGAVAADYLVDQHVLHWVAEDGETVVGHLLCYLQRRRADEPLQVMLYEIGVRRDHRRQGIGRTLMSKMEEWMREAGVGRVWVLADNQEAEAFYAACGFSRDDPQPVQMSRRL